MFALKFNLLLLLMFSYVLVSNCERRIVGGIPVSTNQSYVVYLVKADLSGKNYDFWVCGGALVTVDFIITSAACVEDVNYLYAIAGYNKLIEDPRLHETDPCIKKSRKKVIFTCVPVSYQFDYDLLEKWAYIDIALVKVESPYDLEDTSYLDVCSYIPTLISINYDAKYQNAGMDAMVLGWGHPKSWRQHGDPENYNMKELHYAPTMVMDKAECMEEYAVYPNMSQLIDNYMICTLENGNIDDNGKPIVLSEPTASGCSTQQKLLGLKECQDDEGNQTDDTRRARPVNETTSNDTMNDLNDTMNDFIKRAAVRRNGICQNDHGGPLVTWVGTSKILIGIASVFKVSDKNRCIGPYLYTSTQCNGAFLDCVLTSEELVTKKKTRRGSELCDSPPSVKGYNTVERKISWKDHPAGPADNEIKELKKRNERIQYSAEQGKYPIVERHIENGKFIETVNYPVKTNKKKVDNGRYVETVNYPVNTNEKNIENGRYIETVSYPVNTNEKNVENERYTENLNYPVHLNEKKVEKEKYTENLNYQVNANKKNVENGKYVETVNYSVNLNEKNVENERYTENLNYPVDLNEKNVEKEKYTENLNYPVNANKKNGENGKYVETVNYPVDLNEKNVENERYTENFNYPGILNEKNVENGRYVEIVNYPVNLNEKNVGNERYTENVNFPAILNEKNVENGRYVETVNYPVNLNEKNVENEKYTENMNYPVNTNEKNVENERYTENMNSPTYVNDNIGRVGSNYNEQLFIRPQRPLRE